VALCGLPYTEAPELERVGAAITELRHVARLTAQYSLQHPLRTELARFGRVRHAVVLGAGGASRAAQAALADLGASVEVIDRAHWDGMAEALERADLLVNATPIGTASDDSPVPRTLLRDDLRVLDLVYRPSPTRLVRDARAVGAAARGGAGMLLRQAALSFELWTGGEAPIALMRAALAHELGNELDA
jgi:shikimate dehydrogenase